MNDEESDQSREPSPSMNRERSDDYVVELAKKDLDDANDEELKEMTNNLNIDTHSLNVLRSRMSALNSKVMGRSKMTTLANMQSFTHKQVVSHLTLMPRSHYLNHDPI